MSKAGVAALSVCFVLATHGGGVTAAGIVADELIVDFGSGLGTYLFYDNTSWSLLSTLSPDAIAVGDLDVTGADELIVDFGAGVGLWAYYDNTSWVPLHALDPELLAVGDFDHDGKDDLVVDFGPGVGVYVRYNDASWELLATLDPQSMTVGDLDADPRNELIVDFGAEGIWIYYNGSGWSKLHDLSPELMATGDLNATGLDELIIDFGAQGIWVFYDGSGWFKLHDLSPELMLTGDLNTTGLDELIIDFGGQGIWVFYDGDFWSQLHGLSPELMTSGNLNGIPGDDLAVDFGPSVGVWVLYDNTTWTLRHGLSPTLITVADTNAPPLACRDLFFSGFVVAADNCLQAALATNPEDEEAHLLRSITRLARIVEEQADGPDGRSFTDSLKELLDAFGVPPEHRSLFDFDPLFPDPLLVDSPTGGDFQEFLRNVFLAELQGAIEQNLDSIGSSFSMIVSFGELQGSLMRPAAPFRELLEQPVPGIDAAEPVLQSLSAGLTSAASRQPALGVPPPPQAFEIDFGDASFFEASLRALYGSLVTTLLAPDLDVDIDELDLLVQNRPSGIQDVLDQYRNLLTLGENGAADLLAAKDAFRGAIDAYYAASFFVRSEDDPDQSDDVLTIGPADLAEEQETRIFLGEIYCSLEGYGLYSVSDESAICNTKAGPSLGGQPVNLSAFFAPPLELRSVLPQFEHDAACGQDWVDTSIVDRDSPFPDPTFNGIFPGMTQQDLLLGLGLPGTIEIFGSHFILGQAGFTSTTYLFAENVSELAAPIEITAVAFLDGTTFSVEAGPLPVTLCEFGGLFLEVSFTPPVSGPFTDILVLESSAGEFTFKIDGCADCSPQSAAGSEPQSMPTAERSARRLVRRGDR